MTNGINGQNVLFAEYERCSWLALLIGWVARCRLRFCGLAEHDEPPS